MRKWGLVLLVAALLATPVLACGFPLPAGTKMMRVSKAVCAEGETPATCQARQDAFQLMGKLQSAAVPDLEVNLVIDNAGQQMEVSLKGSFEYQLTQSDEGLGANVHATLDEATMSSGGVPTPMDNTQFIVIGNRGYTSEDGGQTWTYQDLDTNTMLGISMLLGLGGPSGAGLDLYASPKIFDVTTGPDTEYDGQTMQVQTLTVDLQALLSTQDALVALMNDGFAVSGPLGVDQSTLGMPPEQFAAVAVMLLPFLQGTEASTTLYIGADDGYVHFIQEQYALLLDLTATDPTAGKITMTYEMMGHITQHNAPLAITEPVGASEGAGLFSGEGSLFGGGGLGSSLFGGQ